MIEFPDPRITGPEGLVAVGGEWKADTLLAAYSKGIFPWPQPDLPILWFSPEHRGVLDFKELHIPRSLKKFAKHCDWIFTRDQAFPEVMQACRRQARPGQDGTWILPEMIPAYNDLRKKGFATSVECWRDGVLVGGIYGVLLDGLFSGESMFHHADNASKMCFLHMVKCLMELGHQWMDIQMITPLTKSFGGKYISREAFLKRRKIV